MNLNMQQTWKSSGISFLLGLIACTGIFTCSAALSISLSNLKIAHYQLYC